MAYSADGRLLAWGSGFLPDDIRLWNSVTGEGAGSLVGHRAWISALQSKADSRWLVSGSAVQTIRIWNVSTRETARTWRGHQDEVWSLALSPDNATIYGGSEDGVLSRWALTTNPPPSQSVELASSRTPAFLHDGKSVAAIGRGGAVFLVSPGEVVVGKSVLETRSPILALRNDF